jgi:protein-disulfide isomerase
MAAMPENKTSRINPALYIPASIVIAGIIIGVSVIIALRPAASIAQGAAPAVNIKDVNTADEPYIGDKNAPVTLAFWADYQCPYCKAIEVGGVDGVNTNNGRADIAPAIPDVIKNYVDTGKLKIVFKDYTFLGEDSVTAAEYGRSIWKLYPEKYFTFRTKMYTAQDEEGDKGFGDEPSILQLLTKIPGIDVAKVKADVAANKASYDAAADADRAEGTKFGISGTPGFITGKTLIPGFVDYTSFTDAIDKQL